MVTHVNQLICLAAITLVFRNGKWSVVHFENHHLIFYLIKLHLKTGFSLTIATVKSLGTNSQCLYIYE